MNNLNLFFELLSESKIIVNYFTFTWYNKCFELKEFTIMDYFF